LKKQQKNSLKAGKTPGESDTTGVSEGKVTQEAVDKVSKEFEIELEKLRTELEQQKKERISVDAAKRTLDLQLSSLRDQVEQEERARKKIDVSKKTLQLELDDIKLLADESEETKEELERLRKEHEQYKKELSTEREKEKVARYSAEEQVEKFKVEVEDVKRQLGEAKNANANNLKSLRSKYERQIADIEEVIDKAKKDKTGNQRDGKKQERILREVTRRLENSEIDMQNAEEKASQQYKELKKYQDEYQVEARKLSAFESQNALLQKDIESIKGRLQSEEDDLRRVRNQSDSAYKSSSKALKATAANGDDDEQ
jgi:chromosome segregation ATPase